MADTFPYSDLDSAINNTASYAQSLIPNAPVVVGTLPMVATSPYSDTNSAINNTASYAQTLIPKSPKTVSSLSLTGNADGDLDFYTPTNQTFQWSATEQTWHMWIKPVGNSSDKGIVSLADSTSGTSGAANAVQNTFDPKYLEWRYINMSSDNIAVSTQQPNVFIHTGSGQDAIQVTTGRNVLDGGTGSNFLVGGDGIDTFFTDARSPGVTWDTLENFHAGDAATLWGFVPGTSRYWWDGISGADGHQGATLRADIRGTGNVDASITFSGLSMDQAARLQISTAPAGAEPYLYVSNPGV